MSQIMIDQALAKVNRVLREKYGGNQCWWDKIYIDLRRELLLNRGETIHKDIKIFILVTRLYNLIISLINIVKILTKKKPGVETILFRIARSNKESETYIDEFLDPILNDIKINKIGVFVVNDYPKKMIREMSFKFFKIKGLQIDKSEVRAVSELLSKEIASIKVDIIADIICNLYYGYVNRFYLYNLLFKLSNFKSLIFTRYGTEISLMDACRENSVRSFEVQHHPIIENSILYDRNSRLGFNKYQADFIIQTQFIFNPANISSVIYKKETIRKYSAINIRLDRSEDMKDLFCDVLIVSTALNGTLLCDLACFVALNNPTRKVGFKRHPNDINKKILYFEKLKNFSNAIFFEDDVSGEELIELSLLVVGIKGALIHHAVSIGKPIIVIMESDYYVNNKFTSYMSLDFFKVKKFFDSLFLYAKMALIESAVPNNITSNESDITIDYDYNFINALRQI